MMPVMLLPPTGLPIEDEIDAVRSALAVSGTAILQAEPGAGKTTVVPIRLLDEPWLAGRKIVMLEPRRVAARAAARRMASLLGEQPGDTVGWVTRDDRAIGPATRVEVVTEGVLTGRLVNDPGLAGIGLIIFDEFHERSLVGDTGLALAAHFRRIGTLESRLLVMSATIDSAAVAEFVSDSGEPAPVIDAPGRTHPIEIRWKPRRRRHDPLVPAVVAAVQEAWRAPGSVLVFLPGIGEIKRTEDAIRAEMGPFGADVMPLHGSLPAADQDAALMQRSTRRIVLSTDIAQTSLTVDGIGTVVDAGLDRVPRYDPRTAMTTLETVTASRAAADQRAGRAGRLGPGICIRLWSKVEHGSRPAFLPPEITQVDLAGLVLDLARRGVHDRLEVPFIDPPPQRAWDDAIALLRSLGALDEAGMPTERTLAMASLPVHPRLARMVTGSRQPWLACLLAALIDGRDILRGRPSDLPADIASRVELMTDESATHPAADHRAIREARDRAHDLARRAGVSEASVDPADCGEVLAVGFPDRVARSRRERGQFVMAGGRSLKVARNEPIAESAGLVAFDLGGRPKDPILNRGARLEAIIDHIVYATPDLDATVDLVTREWGIAPAPGGRHDGLGTRNSLLSLGGRTYLELVGPDPDQPDPPGARPFGIDDLAEPRLVTWAAGVPDIDLWVSWARGRGFDPGEPIAMSRTIPTGEVLRWRLTLPEADTDGVMPFLIEWPGVNPAASAPEGCVLMGFSLFHNDPAMASRIAEHALSVTIEKGQPAVIATLLTPSGIVEIRS